MSRNALRDIARTDNAAKTVKNAFVNYIRSNGRYYVADPTFVLGNDSLSLIFNRFADPTEFFVRDRMAFTVQMDTYDSVTFNAAQLCDRTHTIDLYPPAPVHSVSITEHAPGDTSWYRGYFPQFISSDTSVNNALNSTRSTYINPTVLPGCNSDWHKSISFYVGGIFGDIGAGAWLYKKDRDSVFATYDFGLTLPFDEQGKPFVYIPSIKLTVDTVSGILDSPSVKWFVYSPAANRFDEVTDMDAIKRSVSSLIINPYDNAAPRNMDFSSMDTSAFNMHQKFPAETLYVGKAHEKRIQGITVQFVTCGVHISEDWMIGF